MNRSNGNQWFHHQKELTAEDQKVTKKSFLKKLIDLELCVVTILPENKNIVYLEMGRITKWYLRMCLYNWGAVWKLKHAK